MKLLNEKKDRVEKINNKTAEEDRTLLFYTIFFLYFM